jgi:hypothetical protein
MRPLAPVKIAIGFQLSAISFGAFENSLIRRDTEKNIKLSVYMLKNKLRTALITFGSPLVSPPSIR